MASTTLRNASLAIVGDIDPVKTRALVEKYFGGIPRADPPRRDVPSPLPLLDEKRVVSVVSEAAHQSPGSSKRRPRHQKTCASSPKSAIY